MLIIQKKKTILFNYSKMNITIVIEYSLKLLLFFIYYYIYMYVLIMIILILHNNRLDFFFTTQYYIRILNRYIN